MDCLTEAKKLQTNKPKNSKQTNQQTCFYFDGFVEGVCLFVWGFTSLSTIFHSYGDVTITVEVLQILTHAWHSWTLNNENSLTCHTS